MLPTLLSGPTHQLRPLRSDDLRVLRAWRQPGSAWSPSPSLEWPTGEDRLDGLLYASDGQRALAVSPHGGGELAAMLVLTALDWKNRAFVISLVAPARRADEASPPELEALEVLARFAYRELGMERLEAEVYADDERAGHLLAAAGFTREAVKRQGASRHGALVDAAVWSRLRGDFREPAGP